MNEQKNALKGVYIFDVCKEILTGSFVLLCFFLLLANETFEKVANVGLHVNMILYLLQEYHFDPATPAIVIFLWNNT